jgi:hypothetical protein
VVAGEDRPVARESFFSPDGKQQRLAKVALMSNRRSTYDLLTWPESLRTTLVLLALIITLSPYLAGADFGIFKVPTLPGALVSAARWTGPCALLAAFLAFLPIWPDRQPTLHKRERIETRQENWVQDALNHAEKVLRHIDDTRSASIQEGGLMKPDQIDLAILEALTPEYSPARLEVVEALDDVSLKEALANVQEAFRAVRIAQMDLANGAAPASEEYEPMYVVQWYTTQLTNFRSVARRLLSTV